MTITKDSQAPLVVVVGATGTQGGSVIRHLAQSDHHYRIRALTRDVNKPAVKALVEQGAEAHQIQIAVGQEDAVKKAFEGADIIFAVTDFWAHMDRQREVNEGKMMADAARSLGPSLRLFIFSGLLSMSKGSQGKYTQVHHFDGKAEIVDYARSINLPVVDVQSALYFTNLSGPFAAFTYDPSNETYSFAHPRDPKWEKGFEKKLPWNDTERDYGLFVRAVVESKDPLAIETVCCWSDMFTQHGAIEVISKVSGKKVVVKDVTPEEFSSSLQQNMKLPPPVAQELVESALSHSETGYYQNVKPYPHDKLPGKPRHLEEWAKEQDWDTILNRNRA